MAKSDSRDEALLEAAQKAFQTPFGASILLDPEDAPALRVDGAASPPFIAAAKGEDQQADCIWRGSHETMLRVLEGERALESAYVAGRIKIAGDMSVMARLELGKPR